MTKKKVIKENKSSVYLLNKEKEHAKASKNLTRKKRHSYFYTETYFILDVIQGTCSNCL